MYSFVSVLHGFYYNKAPNKRRFLLFDEYLVANEVKNPGSLIWRWCSLCQLEKGFFNYENFVAHFFDFHAICHSVFKCSSCKFETGFLDIFLDHVSSAHQDIKVDDQSIDRNISSELYKSFADYIAMRKGSLTLINFGIPSPKGIKAAITRNKGVAEMDFETQKAKNVIYLKTVLFKIIFMLQKKICIIH